MADIKCMTIKKSDSWIPWEFENKRMRKSLPTDLVPADIIDSEDDRYRSFLLTLAMIFNDLKGLVIINDSIKEAYRMPLKLEISEHVGEKEGIAVQMLKILFATLHEALEFLNQSDDVYKSKRFQLLLQRTSSENQLVWEMLVKIALHESTSDNRFDKYKEIQGFLVEARNNVGFHYQTHKRLIDGYRKFFIEGISNVVPEARKFAYWSIAREFSDSRYYYADASLQGYYINLFGDEKLAQERVEEIFGLLNLVVYSIHDVLKEYHSNIPNR
ncbi:MAG: hypothetical protein AAB773_01355 [Patescibacteria group bacterium]